MREIGFHGENTEVKVKLITHCGVNFRIITFFHNLPHFFRDNILNDNRHQPYCALTSPFVKYYSQSSTKGKNQNGRLVSTSKALQLRAIQIYRRFCQILIILIAALLSVQIKHPSPLKNTFCINFNKKTSGVWLKISI